MSDCARVGSSALGATSEAASSNGSTFAAIVFAEAFFWGARGSKFIKSTDAAKGLQATHSFAWGGISTPHSGQIEENMGLL
jgi:hypothetical protein